MRLVLLPTLMLLAGCPKPPTPSEVCAKLVSAGVASNCHAETPAGLGGRAREEVAFDLPSVPGHGGGVYGFETDADYSSTVQSFEAAAVLAGPWRFGSAKARIFVQMNDGAKPEVGAKARAVVDGL